MEVSEDIQRELLYGLSALLLACAPDVPTGGQVARRLLDILGDEGPRFHEPDLVTAWAEESGWFEELEEALEDALELILDELADDEEPFAANQVLALLEEEPFWTLRWGGSGGQSHVPIRAVQEGALVLPLALRRDVVRALDQLEVTLFELQSDQRSVHDRLDDRLIDGLVAATVRNLRELGRARKIPDLPRALVQSAGLDRPFEALLGTIQRWKLSVRFDAGPDDDDGEWTWRVLERLFRVDWVPGDRNAQPVEAP